MCGIFGQPMPVYQSAWNDANKELKNQVKLVNKALADGKGFLVGGALSLADIFVAMVLTAPFQTVLDAGFRKAMGAVSDWAPKMYALSEVKGVQGAIMLCAKPMKPKCVEEPKAPKAEKKKEDKP